MEGVDYTAYILTLAHRGPIEPAKPKSSSPNRTKGVIKIGKHVHSPSKLKTGEAGIPWKKQKVGDAGPSSKYSYV
jgi:hypothetical protein